ncbi:hypothetical protein [Haliscomenobacter hydrossis]|uniref:MoxR-vWA-beta-propeller ternary system domain-containing protein n=1 Tax=Haliscomenobacter hydrossis (strain ATCC 27775 / DSM 1100 / LMG 10767 / O) TaxID=760192 RepID=F4L0D2_HALH1|nr:hypothetical protein [Haliscomenobacter hydrossis]AEE53805.1 hypothetical protein Halhy_5982 [Haliscomenobacter hydrossis DSM 1100]
MSSLNQFLSDLWENGKVEVAHEVQPFSPTELLEAQRNLHTFYRQDCLHFPGTAPEFDATAALWSAQYLYRATQFILLRHLNEQAMQEQLMPWMGQTSPAVTYSADLCLRHLPTLLNFAKGLSPADVLVLNLKKTATDWPFSGVGIAEENVQAEELILSHPTLALAYVDRIIAKRLQAKAQQAAILPWVAAALGDHANLLWPEWNH